MTAIGKQYVIRHKETRELFSDYGAIQEDGKYKLYWNSHNPWVYSRECDALFVLYQGLELTDEAEVIEFI